jgi:hypothetical protein
LSGGGIRSATFCLGVLQGLARVDDPGAPAALPDTDGVANEARGAAVASTPPAARTRWPLLAQFDMLSTVSGGGYIGGFFSALFVRGRLSGRKDEPEAETTARAYAALLEEPPGRIHRSTVYDQDRPGQAALAWLRDNGRYMAPTGAGDLLYGVTIGIRNWMATQYVMATLMIVLLALWQVARWWAVQADPGYAQWEASLLPDPRGGASGAVIWWSPAWAASAILFVLCGVPLGMAYWFSHPSSGYRLRADMPDEMGARVRNRLASPPQYVTLASVCGLLMGVLLCALGVVLINDGEAEVVLGASTLGAGGMVLLAVLAYGLSTWWARDALQGSITYQRVLLTRWLTRVLSWAVLVVALAVVDTAAQTAWCWASWLDRGMATSALGSALMAAAVWLLKSGVMKLGDAGAKKGAPSVLQRLPLGALAGVLGAVLWAAVAAAWGVLVLAVVWPAGPPSPRTLLSIEESRGCLHHAIGLSGVAVLLALVVGRFPGFLNLSTLQSLYSARLIRAYLGASNFLRFADADCAKAREVAEPIREDSLSVDQVYANPLAPIHYVNVCVNQSVSPGEQLVQRDRKGKPLVVAPNGFYFDQRVCPMWHSQAPTELAYPLSFGEWLGVSGAAFSTGLGRGTELGMSMLLGFANVRLGRWWQGLAFDPRQPSGWAQRLLPTQTYLFDELQGRFYGDHRPYLYLSDGGHFENTAAYELLRTDRGPRRVRLIVVCDCGCDPDYTFADLANLTRLVRIDQGLEITPHPTAHLSTLLNTVFALPADFQRDADGQQPLLKGRCAVMLDVRGTARSASRGIAAGELVARIVLIKPTLMPEVAMDVGQYHSGHGAFPQETTMDQFFDEAQWESYRQLGLRSALKVFTGGVARPMPGYAEALWRVALTDLPA